jgi:hypothetical protein
VTRQTHPYWVPCIFRCASMDPTVIRVISGVVFVVVVFIIIARRKGMASKRKRIS